MNWQYLFSLKLGSFKVIILSVEHFWMYNERNLCHFAQATCPCPVSRFEQCPNFKSLKVIPMKSLRIHWWMSFSLNDRRGLLLQVRDSWSSLWLKFREFRLCHNQNIFRLNPYILKWTNMVLTTAMDGQFIHKIIVF